MNFHPHSRKANKRKAMKAQLKKAVQPRPNAPSADLREELGRIAYVIDSNNAVFKDALHNTEAWLSILRMALTDMVGGLLKTVTKPNGKVDVDYEHYIKRYNDELSKLDAAKEQEQTVEEPAESSEDDPSTFTFGGDSREVNQPNTQT